MDKIQVPEMKHFPLKMPQQYHDSLSIMKVGEKRTINNLILEAIEQYIEGNKIQLTDEITK